MKFLCDGVVRVAAYQVPGTIVKNKQGAEVKSVVFLLLEQSFSSVGSAGNEASFSEPARRVFPFCTVLECFASHKQAFDVENRFFAHFLRFAHFRVRGKKKKKRKRGKLKTGWRIYLGQRPWKVT